MPRKSKADFPMAIFLQRLDELRDRRGLTKDADFHRATGLKGTRRWRNPGYGSLETDTLLVIAQYFQVSLDWLLGRSTGEFPDYALAAGEAQPAYAAAPFELNEELLAATIDLVNQVLLRRRLKLSSRQQALLISRIYTDCAESRTRPSLIQVERNLLFALAMSQT